MVRKKKSWTAEEDEIEMDNDGPSSKRSLYEGNSAALYLASIRVYQGFQFFLLKVIGVERAATPQEIRKAYHKLPLRLHPDKNQDDGEAKEKFQQLQKVMSVLGDEKKRAVNDQTGSADDADFSGGAFENFRDFFWAMYKKVTIADIEEFEANYRGSESEKKDLIELFSKFKGKMNRLFGSMLCSDPMHDLHRFKDILDEAIAAGELKSSKAYEKWAKKISESKPPTNPSRKRRKSAKDSETDLALLISQRRDERKGKVDSMFTSLISRYGGNVEAEPSEEEFEAAKRRIESRRPSKKSKRK